jgi:hypothetical protein
MNPSIVIGMEKMIFLTVPRPHPSAILIWVGDIAGLSLLVACLLYWFACFKFNWPLRQALPAPAC